MKEIFCAVFGSSSFFAITYLLSTIIISFSITESIECASRADWTDFKVMVPLLREGISNISAAIRITWFISGSEEYLTRVADGRGLFSFTDLTFFFEKGLF